MLKRVMMPKRAVMLKRVALLLVACLLAGAALAEQEILNPTDITDPAAEIAAPATEVADPDPAAEIAAPATELAEEIAAPAVEAAVEELPEQSLGVALEGAGEVSAPETEVLIAAPEWNEAPAEEILAPKKAEFVITDDDEPELAGYNGKGGDVEIPEGVAQIYDSGVFENNLTSVTFPTTMKHIMDEVFQGQSKLVKVVFQSNVATGDYVFARCPKLKTVVLPEGFEVIGYGCFEDCESLKTLALPGSLKRISTAAFQGSGIESLALPEGLERIGEGAFAGCAGLTEMVIPASVTNVFTGAFENCGNLARVTFLNPETLLSESLFEEYDYEAGEFVPSCDEDLVIRGWEGSTAEDYADAWGYEFEPLSAVAKISLNKSGTQTLKLGKTLKLKAAVQPAAAAQDFPVTWTSSDEDVATVSAAGVVTPVAKGEVKITATAGEKHRTLKVKVVAPRPSAVALSKAGKKLANNKTISLKKGRSVTLKPVLTPAFAETTFTWKTSKKSVATVSRKGKIKAVGKGTATITLRTANGLKVRVKVKVK